MKVAIDSDRTGLQLKREITTYFTWPNLLLPHALRLIDLNSQPSEQYPDIAFRMAKLVAAGDFERGILICGTGLGMAMTACKVPGIYAGCCHNVEGAQRLAVKNNAQIMTMGSDFLSRERGRDMAFAFIFAPFEARPNAQRMREIEQLCTTPPKSS